MVERVVQHRHCKNCEKAVAYKDQYCDDKCETEWKTKMLTKKRQLLFFYVAMVAVMIMAIVMLYLG